jgi:transposase InsO family protein
VSGELDLWAKRGVTLDFSRPGKPTDNAFIEAFNGRFAENLDAVPSKYSIADWERPRHHQVNAIRFHGSLSSELLDDRNIIAAVTHGCRRIKNAARKSSPRCSGGCQYSTACEARCLGIFHHANLPVPTWTTNHDKTLPTSGRAQKAKFTRWRDCDGFVGVVSRQQIDNMQGEASRKLTMQ